MISPLNLGLPLCLFLLEAALQYKLRVKYSLSWYIWYIYLYSSSQMLIFLRNIFCLLEVGWIFAFSCWKCFCPLLKFVQFIILYCNYYNYVLIFSLLQNTMNSSRTEVSRIIQFSSVAQSCPTLCYPMNRSMPGLPVHHQLPEFTQTHIHRVSDAIQPSHPLSSPSPPAPNPSQRQSLFQWVNSSDSS